MKVIDKQALSDEKMKKRIKNEFLVYRLLKSLKNLDNIVEPIQQMESTEEVLFLMILADFYCF